MIWFSDKTLNCLEEAYGKSENDLFWGGFAEEQKIKLNFNSLLEWNFIGVELAWQCKLLLAFQNPK